MKQDYIPKFALGDRVYCTLPDRAAIRSVYYTYTHKGDEPGKEDRVRIEEYYIPSNLKGPAIVRKHQSWGEYGFEYGVQFDGEGIIRYLPPRNLKQPEA